MCVLGEVIFKLIDICISGVEEMIYYYFSVFRKEKFLKLFNRRGIYRYFINIFMFIM